jgi:hypothetical protein
MTRLSTGIFPFHGWSPIFSLGDLPFLRAGRARGMTPRRGGTQHSVPAVDISM